MTAKRLQSKLFGAVKEAATIPTRKKDEKESKSSSPADTPRDEDSPGSGAATPVTVQPAAKELDSNNIKLPQAVAVAQEQSNENNGESGGAAPLHIDIPGQRGKESLPKRAERAEVKRDEHTPVPAGRSPRTASGEETPRTPRENKSLRDRLAKQLGSEYRSVEDHRLHQSDLYEVHWKRWGPYVSERQWGTVREDYSANGDAWNSFPFEMAKSRAYRWGEDGIAGISDNHQRMCFTLALWNGKDPILKERLYGLTGEQGNHGEDVKELYYYLDSTPTHSYMKCLYKYPQAEFPYQKLREENRNRGRDVPEYELMDTGVFDDDRYWDVFVEYAKDEEDPNSISIRITAYNRGPDPADLHILPQLFFRNTWSWPAELPKDMPHMRQVADGVIEATHETLGVTRLYCTPSPGPAQPTRSGVVMVDGPSIVPDLLFTENETNFERLYGGKNRTPYCKDAFYDYVIPSSRPKSEQPDKAEAEVDGVTDKVGELDVNAGTVPAETFVNPNKEGTKAGAHYVFNNVPGRGGCVVVRLKMTPNSPSEDATILDEEAFDDNIEDRRCEADEFYATLGRGPLSDDLRSIMRQALAGMMWTKQYYQFIQKEWIEGDPGQPKPPAERKYVRNREWRHLYINDILSMPDKWEYPWFATWDTAFHCVPLAMVDPSFAKKQLDLLTREWYMKPDGALPAYEWNFSDVNPPVHAWATLRVFKIERQTRGVADLDFLERVFQKLLLNFTWWVNRKDADGNNVFEGGFLGLDNIGPFNRSEPLPTGGSLHQADASSWMGQYCLQMLSISLELALHNPTYEDIASKFFEHFIFIADAMTYHDDERKVSLWNEKDGFYYDAIQWEDGHAQQIPVRSLVGLMPLYATAILEPHVLRKFPSFRKRNLASMKARGRGDRLLLAFANKERLVRILEKMLDEDEFFSDYGIRSLSLYHKDHPFSMVVDGHEYGVGYWPGDSKSGMFGGNSNWRGPIWLAPNLLLIESLQRFHQYYGDDLQVECPTGSGYYMNLAAVAEEIQHRIIHIFNRDEEGRRAVNAGAMKLDRNPYFRDYVHFFEFFHGDDGRGLGASHQTGWTGLIAWMIHRTGEWCRLAKTPKTPRGIANHYFGDQIPTPYTAGTASTPGLPYTPSEGSDARSAFPGTPHTDMSGLDEPEPDEL
ncbi:hypothetical protein CspeluHIS016_0503450 [Cutaneotrichosporon spelunceum]|uniref:Glycosyl hydrolase family 63 C-terminal domain-containing protein n=1 Tax=Cutaneotrichosporon spelunceum TaxID=1672016 RepID=A0AAD3YDN8_9TREE|nr:hypothetical protein CspeluHIS016_0503450 [Cutaneotrichosporon spelunceum]